MTTYRFRVKFEYDPTERWRDIVVGAGRTLDEFQTVLNRAVGLNQDHLWFFGTDQDYWQSPVQYKRPDELEQAVPTTGDEDEYNAAETTVGEMVQRLNLQERDRLCYLFDHGDEWRVYAILTEVDEDGASDSEPEVVTEKGDPVDQYAPPGERL